MLMGHQRTLLKDNEGFKILKDNVRELNGSAENECKMLGDVV